MAKISNFGMHTAYLLGFKRIADVRGISSIMSLFENAMILSGIYLQIRPDHHVYIGKTSNMIRRFEQHRQNGIVIEELAFLPIQKRFLDKKEKEIIAKAQRFGIALDNLLLVESEQQEKRIREEFFRNFDTLKWVNESDPTSGEAYSSEKSENFAPSFYHQLHLAQAHPCFTSVLSIARCWVNDFIPQPCLTVGSFWSAEAYSSDRTDHFLPLIRLHAGSQTLLTLGVFKRAPNQPWLSILCQTDVLATHRFNQQEFCEKFPFVFLQTVNPNYCSFSMHAHMSESVLQELKKALRQTTVNLLRQPLIRNGNLLLHQKLI